MNELETRQLRYFVTVAEELHFGRAAERLGMAQPPLSRAIRGLERQLGVTLLERHTRRVALTPAGETLLADARIALEAITAAGRRARNAGRTPPGIRLALKADNDSGLLPAILDTYAAQEAAVPVDLVFCGFGEQAQAVRDGRADIALILCPFDDRGLDYEPLLTEPFLIALSSSDPLAARSSLCLADLAGRRLPGGEPADLGPSASGTARDGERTFSNLTEILRLVELGTMACFLPASIAQRYDRPEIAYRPVADAGQATLVLAWPEGSRSPALAAFVRAAGEAAAARPRRDHPRRDPLAATPLLSAGVEE